MNENKTTSIYKVEGMACNHCKATVGKALASLPGVSKVEVDLPTGSVAITGDVDSTQVAEAVANAGFTFVGEVG